MISNYPDRRPPPAPQQRGSRLADCPGAADIGLDQPSAARVYDFLLGGASNFEVDRQAGQAILDAAPDSATTARANRAFLGRLVRYLVKAGVDQILDLGSGLPTVGNVHSVAQHANPRARVVYVDCDPVAVVHARNLVADNALVGVVEADLRTPSAVLDDPITRQYLDFTRPVAVLMISVLHFVGGDLPELIGAYRQNLVPGSMLGISHATPPAPTAEQRVAAERVAEVYQQTPTPIHLRDGETIRRLFDGFDLLEPGLVPVDQWRPAGTVPAATMADSGTILGALGRLPVPRPTLRAPAATRNPRSLPVVPRGGGTQRPTAGAGHGVVSASSTTKDHYALVRQ